MFFMLSAIAFPVLAAGISVLRGHKFSEKGYRTAFVAAVLVIETVLVLASCAAGGQAGLSVTSGIRFLFRMDDLGRFFAAFISIVWMLVGIYSFEYMEHEERQTNFYRFYLLTEAAIMGILFAGNYITLYMCFELMSLLSFPMVMNSHTKASIIAAQKYLYYSVFGASLGLIGLFYFSSYTVSDGFMPGGCLDAAKTAGHEGLLLAVTMAVIIGFGTKAGMFPMHAWLPTAHPEAPSPASAVMSGVITKCGVIAIIRVVFYVTGADFIRGTWVQRTWMILTLITVFMGSMLAYKENGFKKRLAYSSVSQVSYILFGFSTLTQIGMAGALLHVLFHSIMKDLLFMCAGAVIIKTGRTKVDQLRGIGKEMPVTMWCFTIAGLGLTGIPPTAGFVSKWYLAQGSLGSGSGALEWIGPAVLLVSALLTAGYLIMISVHAFLPGADFDYSSVSRKEAGAGMTVPMVILAAAVLILGIWISPIQNFLTGIAGSLIA